MREKPNEEQMRYAFQRFYLKADNYLDVRDPSYNEMLFANADEFEYYHDVPRRTLKLWALECLLLRPARLRLERVLGGYDYEFVTKEISETLREDPSAYLPDGMKWPKASYFPPELRKLYDEARLNEQAYRALSKL